DHRERVTRRRMFAQHSGKFGIAARILVLVRLALRAIGIPCTCNGHFLSCESFADLERDRAHLLDLLWIGARTIAAPGGGDGDAALGITNTDMERGQRAH